MGQDDQDLVLIRDQLWEVESKAKRLSWAKDRPWKPSTHVWIEEDLTIIDLHDLSVKLALSVVRTTCRFSKKLQSSAICFVTGAGNKSVTGAKIRPAVITELEHKCSDKDWEFFPHGLGRIVLIFDRENAPKSLSGKTPFVVKFGGLAFLIFLFVLLFRSCTTV